MLWPQMPGRQSKEAGKIQAGALGTLDSLKKKFMLMALLHPIREASKHLGTQPGPWRTVRDGEGSRT